MAGVSKQSNSAVSSEYSSPTIAREFARQSEKLSLEKSKDGHGEGQAVQAKYITSRDPIITTEEGKRLPAVPIAEAEKLNALNAGIQESVAPGQDGSGNGDNATRDEAPIQIYDKGSLRNSMPPPDTHPLFPPLPLHGPPSILRNIQCWTFRITAFSLSSAFLGLIVMGALCQSIPVTCRRSWLWIRSRDPDSTRPFYEEEKRLKVTREEANKNWRKKVMRRKSTIEYDDKEAEGADSQFIPQEGGRDPVICDVGYYARRVGLDMEEFKVQTEDGFIIILWHLYSPSEYKPLASEERAARGPDVFTNTSRPRPKASRPRFPVLMIHGLMQCSGSFCANDDNSLAFYLCKSGYDVWLGNNRCVLKPEHTLLSYADPRMWAWNIRHMGVMDLPAMTSRVLFETGFEKLGVIGHSQGTTQTFVALAKDQRPELGDKLTVFCALAPAAYAGALIGQPYLKSMRMMSPAVFRSFFGIHAFIPVMMSLHNLMPGRLFGCLAYPVFRFLFDWSDTRWDRGLRDRMFQFAPVYVSAETMKWWLGRDGFAEHECILSTKDEQRKEDEEDGTEHYLRNPNSGNSSGTLDGTVQQSEEETNDHQGNLKSSTAWYNEKVPPFALWVAGSDDLVDGRRLLKRFDNGREPHLKVVHSKVIEEYEHLDVIWAMDAIEQVGREVKEVLWKTCNVRDRVTVPLGCEGIEAWKDDREDGREKEEQDQRSVSGDTMTVG